MALRDFTSDTTALALNTATLGHNLDGYGAGWSPEQVIDACAARGLGGIVFWRREIGDRAAKIGDRVRAAGMDVVGLCRTPYLVGSEAPKSLDDARSTVDMAAALGTEVLTIVTGGTEPGTKGVIESQKRLAESVAELAEYAAPRRVSSPRASVAPTSRSAEPATSCETRTTRPLSGLRPSSRSTPRVSRRPRT